MTNEQIVMDAAKMDTPELVNWLRALADEEWGLKGRVQGNPVNQARKAHLRRYIRILAQEINSRRLTLKGF